MAFGDTLKKNKGLDLEKLATKEKVMTKLPAMGEEPKKIFSGGFISDIFDTLNALQYGVTGLLKGKGFAEGVKTRQSWSDQDALGDEGIPGMIGGLALDIASDPLTYVPIFGWGKAILKGVKGVTEVGGKAITKAPIIGKTAEATGQWLGRKLIYRFGQDPVYKQLAERTIKSIAVGNQNLIDLAKPLTKLNPADQKLIAEMRKAGTLENLPAHLYKRAEPVYKEMDRLSKELADLGVLPQGIYEKTIGKYMPRLYRIYEAKGKSILSRTRAWERMMKRKDIPEGVRQALGEITEAGYPTAKGLVQLNYIAENAKFFNVVNKRFAKNLFEEGFKKLPDTKTLGKLAGKYIPEPIYDDIYEIIRPRDYGLGRKMVAGFKYGKVILNPATHIRNIISNFILNSWEGLSPTRLDIYGEAAKQLTIKGKWYQEAVQQGLGMNTYTANEIKNILKIGEGAKGKLGKIAGKISDFYQGEENYAKMAQYIFQRKAGKTTQEAWRIAERATFNYAQVTPFIRKLRESIFGVPFITFTYKATPQAIKTTITAPTRISNIGKIKTAIENQAGLAELTKERKYEPTYIRDGFYIKLPLKDKDGRSAYFDLTYLIPFGDLVSGQYFTRQISRETGLPESMPETIAEKSPFFNTIKELANNQDFYGNKIWKEDDSTDIQLGDLFRHLLKTYLPPLIADQIPGGYQVNKKTGKLERRAGTISRALAKEKRITTAGIQDRNLMEEILRNFGMKIQPIEADIQETYRNWEKQKALQTILEEEGVIKTFEGPYIPK